MSSIGATVPAYASASTPGSKPIRVDPEVAGVFLAISLPVWRMPLASDRNSAQVESGEPADSLSVRKAGALTRIGGRRDRHEVPDPIVSDVAARQEVVQSNALRLEKLAREDAALTVCAVQRKPEERRLRRKALPFRRRAELSESDADIRISGLHPVEPLQVSPSSDDRKISQSRGPLAGSQQGAH